MARHDFAHANGSMCGMDQALRRQLRAVNADRHSGAAELAVRTATALQAWLAQRERPSEAELLEVARQLCRTQPMMAPFRHLANFAALATERPAPAVFLRRQLATFARTVRTGSRRIARQFRAAIATHARIRVVTFSYSSTVLRSLIAARRHIREVCVSLASPENEGRTMALRLAHAGVQTCLTTDVDLPHFLAREPRTLLVVGADQIRERDFVNRAGTGPLVAHCLAHGLRVWVLADTTKLCAKQRMGMQDAAAGWTESLLRGRHRHLRVSREILTASPLAPNVRVLTEHGRLTPAQVARAIARIDVSARLAALLD